MKPPTIKICGITRESDGDLALRLGADYLGFIVYPKSPRCISLLDAEKLLKHFAEAGCVCVDVAPGMKRVRDLSILPFAAYQLHFSVDMDRNRVAEWSQVIGKKRLWLAPKIPPSSPFPEWILEYTDFVLMDTYHPGLFGGSGEAGDFAAFAQISKKYPNVQFILAGGLNPDNMTEALQQSGANWVDVNSGVECDPGIKDEGELRRLFAQI